MRLLVSRVRKELREEGEEREGRKESVELNIEGRARFGSLLEKHS